VQKVCGCLRAPPLPFLYRLTWGKGAEKKGKWSILTLKGFGAKVRDQGLALMYPTALLVEESGSSVKLGGVS
jgi:hypothetical protein